MRPALPPFAAAGVAHAACAAAAAAAVRDLLAAAAALQLELSASLAGQLLAAVQAGGPVAARGGFMVHQQAARLDLLQAALTAGELGVLGSGHSDASGGM